MNKEEILKVKNECKRFLHGHYPRNPRQYFSEMSSQVSSDERADHYGQGESLRAFETSLAKLFGHEDSVFFQSGTMAQLIAVRIWSDLKKNPLIAFHPTCHLELHEQNSYKELHNLDSLLVGSKDRLIDLEDLEKMNQTPSTVLLELPQREIGGQLPEWDDLQKQINFLRSMDIKIHLDGARLWECASFYNKSYDQIAALFDSVYISFYKGVGAVAGAALLGPKTFTEQARIWNRRHGGNLITSFPLYLSAKCNLEKRIGSFGAYYKKTLEIADLISELGGVELIPKTPQVNMFHVIIRGTKEELVNRAVAVSKQTGIWGFAHVQPTEKDGFCKLEWYVGDATIDIPLPLIKEFLIKVLGVDSK